MSLHGYDLIPAHNPAEIKQTPLDDFPRNDQYHHVTFTEDQSPDLVIEAQRIHAEGYHSAGFVSEEAITEDGALDTSIDKSRGPNVDYFLAINLENADDCGTMRKIHIPTGKTYQDLPGYRLTRDALSSLGEHYLASLNDRDNRLKEISAMAVTKKGKPLAAHEIFRDTIQAALGRDEVWFFSIVSTTHDSLTKSFGAKNMQVLGNDTPIGETSETVADNIALRPAVLQPDKFIDNIAEAYLQAEKSTDQKRFARSLLFFIEGLDPASLSDMTVLVRDMIIKPVKYSPITAKEA